MGGCLLLFAILLDVVANPRLVAGAPSPSHSFHPHSLAPTLAQSGDAATSEGGPWSRGGSVPGADSGLEELVEGSEEPCAALGSQV